MLTVKEVYEAVNGFAPFASQESWDNSGLLVGSMTQPADRILTTLDISEEVIAQAVQQQVQLIVAHHPVIFSPLKALPQNSPVYQLAAHGIAAICVHTPLDMSPVGLNAYAHGLLAEPLALENAQSVLEPSWTDGRGFGWIDTSTRTWTPQALVFRQGNAHPEDRLLFRFGGVDAGTGGGKGLRCAYHRRHQARPVVCGRVRKHRPV